MIAATNRADILDPALMRSGRLDRKIEFPHPTEEARARILQVFWHLCLFFLPNLYGILLFIPFSHHEVDLSLTISPFMH